MLPPAKLACWLYPSHSGFKVGLDMVMRQDALVINLFLPWINGQTFPTILLVFSVAWSASKYILEAWQEWELLHWAGYTPLSLINPKEPTKNWSKLLVSVIGIYLQIFKNPFWLFTSIRHPWLNTHLGQTHADGKEANIAPNYFSASAWFYVAPEAELAIMAQV